MFNRRHTYLCGQYQQELICQYNIPQSSKWTASVHMLWLCVKVNVELEKNGWPENSTLNAVLRQYWWERAVLIVQYGLLLRGSRLVIPSAILNSFMEKVHQGHQGIVKRREGTRETVRWPGLSGQLNEFVLHCWNFIKERSNPVLKCSELPEQPWQKFVADMFTVGNSNYLLVYAVWSTHGLWK